MNIETIAFSFLSGIGAGLIIFLWQRSKQAILKFLEHFASVGSKIENAVEAYNKSVSSLDSRVLPTLRKIKELGTGNDDPAIAKAIDIRTKDLKITEKIDAD